MIASSPPRILFQTDAGSPADTEIQYQRYVNTQMGLMRSRFVMNAALQQDGISRLPLLKSQADPVDWLVKNLEVSRLVDSEIVEVSLPPRTGFSSKEQASCHQRRRGAYIDEVVNKDRKQMVASARDAQETLKRLLGDDEIQEGYDPQAGVDGFALPDNL